MPPPPPSGGDRKRGLLIGGLAAAAVCVGVVIVLVAVGLSDSGDETAETTGTVPATTVAPVASGDGSAEAALRPVPGFTFEPVPASAVRQLRTAFDRGFRAGAGEDAEVSPNDAVAGLAARSVVRQGDDDASATAIALKLDDAFAAELPPEDLMSQVSSEFSSSEPTTISGQQAYFYESAGEEGLLTYKNGTFLVVAAFEMDRTMFRELMTGLLANLD